MDTLKIQRALIAVYDKTGIADFARALVDEFGIEIISTGGTAKHLKEAGIPVTMVEQVTGFPEMLDGRVKTLHPKIHAAILADRDNPDHMRQLTEHGIQPIDMVVVNLYPFEQTVADPNCKFEDAIEMIDIGGPCMLRAAAKNHSGVLVACLRQQYKDVLDALRACAGCCGFGFRLACAINVFETTSGYDLAVYQHFSSFFGHMLQRLAERRGESGPPVPPPAHGVVTLSRDQLLRYGENPAQDAALWSFRSVFGMGATSSAPDQEATHARPGREAMQVRSEQEATLVWSEHVSEPPLSFNNYVDGDAALSLVKELTRAANDSRPTEPRPTEPRASARAVWHRRPAGGCGTGVSPVHKAAKQPSWKPIQGETITQRNLPHIQKPGRSYFVTFRVKTGELPPEARDIALSACHYWHGRKMNLHIAVVMPDHVHLLLTPYLHPSGEAVPLGELLHSIKSFSSHEIRKRIGGTGPVWLDENWDRLIRHEQEFAETWDYIDTNPDRAKLPADYAWKWWSGTRFEEGGQVQEQKNAASQQCTGETPVPHRYRRDAGATPPGHRRDASATPPEHRRDAGATPPGHRRDASATPPEHRRDAGATPPGHRRDAGATPVFAVAFIKHTNACGCAVGDDPVDTYQRAYLGDPIAAAGGVLCVNFPVTREFADVVMNSYGSWGKAAGAAFFKLDVWIAPHFEDDAVELITTPTEKRKWGASCRLLAVGDMSTPPDPNDFDYRKITGGMLVQTRDLVGLNEDEWKVVTKRAPSESEMSDLRFAWLVCKHTKSNAISICRDGMLLGNGAGQMSRVKSCDVAIQLARENGHGDNLAGAVAAGDAFFPVPDGPGKLIAAGITAIIQPGGGNRDAETIAACDQAGVAMILTGTRHFKH